MKFKVFSSKASSAPLPDLLRFEQQTGRDGLYARAFAQSMHKLCLGLESYRQTAFFAVVTCDGDVSTYLLCKHHPGRSHRSTSTGTIFRTMLNGAGRLS